MTPKQSIGLLLLVLSFLLAAPVAEALELYGGAGGVKTTLSGSCDGATGSATFSGSCDGSSAGFKAFVGFQLIPLTALEAGYVDFGSAEASGTLGGTPRSLKFEATTVYVAGVLRATFLDRVTVSGKLGAHYWDAKGNLGSASLGTQQSDNGVNVMGGVGVSVRIFGPVGVMAEVERYEGVGNSETTGSANVNVYMLGVVVRF